MSDAPFVEKAVPAETAGAEAKAARCRLQAVLDRLSPAAGKNASDGPKPGDRPKAGKAKQGKAKNRQRKAV